MLAETGVTCHRPLGMTSATRRQDHLISAMPTHPTVTDHVCRMATSQAPPNPGGDRASGIVPDALVDELLAYYIDWRYEEGNVADAYTCWSSAPAGETELLFSVYMAALDQEEAAAGRYAHVAAKVKRASECLTAV